MCSTRCDEEGHTEHGDRAHLQDGLFLLPAKEMLLVIHPAQIPEFTDIDDMSLAWASQHCGGLFGVPNLNLGIHLPYRPGYWMRSHLARLIYEWKNAVCLVRQSQSSSMSRSRNILRRDVGFSAKTREDTRLTYRKRIRIAPPPHLPPASKGGPSRPAGPAAERSTFGK